MGSLCVDSGARATNPFLLLFVHTEYCPNIVVYWHNPTVIYGFNSIIVC